MTLEQLKSDKKALEESITQQIVEFADKYNLPYSCVCMSLCQYEQLTEEGLSFSMDCRASVKVEL